MGSPDFRSRRKTPENKPKSSALARVGHHPPPTQLHLFPIKEVEVDGVRMGVLSDGTPYLTLGGLARLCGVDHTGLLRMTNNWGDEQSKPRGARIKELLNSQGHSGDVLNIQTSQGAETHVYTDAVCMAILEYYAFDATQGSNAIALRNYRLLARHSFRAFIYSKCQYDPDRHLPDSWRNFHERVLLNDQLPVGYFSVFREIADIVVHMIKAGCPLDDHTVPDISVGVTWGNYWEDNSLGSQYGERLKHPHVFPEWFPQAMANPVPAWIYPASALGVFHTWMYRYYLPQKFPRYVKEKVRKGVFLPGRGELLLASVGRKELPGAPQLPHVSI